MKKTIAVAAVALLVIGLASSAFAHGPRGSQTYGPGYGPMMGMGHMMGMGPMMGTHMGWTAGGPPCLTGTTPGPYCSWGPQSRTLTPEEEKEFKERSKTFVERYLERFLPEYQLTPKTTTPNK